MARRLSMRCLIHRNSAMGSLIAAAMALAAPPVSAIPPIAAGGFYTQTQFSGCGSATCSIPFAQIPAGRRLLITNVTCELQTRNSPGLPHIYVGDLNNAGFHHVSPTFLGSFVLNQVTYREYIANGEVLHIVLAERFPKGADSHRQQCRHNRQCELLDRRASAIAAPDVVSNAASVTMAEGRHDRGHIDQKGGFSR